MKLNKKGYMLVELVLSSVLAMSIAFYLLNLTYQFKNKNEDIYESITYSSDKALITKNIMNDLDKYKTDETSFLCPKANEAHLVNAQNVVLKVLQVVKKEGNYYINYGKKSSSDDTSFIPDESYYTKKIPSSMFFQKLECSNDKHSLKIKMKSIYSEDNYDIKLFVK